MDDDEGESQLTNLLELIDDDCVAGASPGPPASGASPSEQRGQLRPFPAATASEANEPPAKTLRSVKLEGDSAGASPAPVKSKAPVACSSAESEYYAMCSGAAEGLFVEALALEMGMQVGGVVLLTDASAAKAMAEKSSIPNRVKHMMIRYLFLQQLLRERRIALQKVGTEDNRADLMTKAVTAPILEKLRGSLGLKILALAVAAPGAEGQMWPEKVSNTVCPRGTDEIMGISLFQLMVFTFVMGVVAGIVGTLLFQFLWAKIFGEQSEPEADAAEGGEQGAHSPPEQVPEEPEPERTGDATPGASPRVYVTPFGKKWHTRQQCQGLLSARRVEPTTRHRAEQGGYGPCRYCGHVE